MQSVKPFNRYHFPSFKYQNFKSLRVGFKVHTDIGSHQSRIIICRHIQYHSICLSDRFFEPTANDVFTMYRLQVKQLENSFALKYEISRSDILGIWQHIDCVTMLHRLVSSIQQVVIIMVFFDTSNIDVAFTPTDTFI